jgi:hypothetical protein
MLKHRSKTSMSPIVHLSHRGSHSRKLPERSAFGKARALDAKAQESISWSVAPDMVFGKGPPSRRVNEAEGANRRRKLAITPVYNNNRFLDHFARSLTSSPFIIENQGLLFWR